MYNKKLTILFMVTLCVQYELICELKTKEETPEDVLEVASVETGNVSSQYADIALLNAGEVWVQDRMLSKAACTKHLCVCDQLCARNIIASNLSVTERLSYPMPYKAYVDIEEQVRYHLGDPLPFGHVVLDPNGDYNIVDSYYKVPKDGFYALTVNVTFFLDLHCPDLLTTCFAVPKIYDRNTNRMLGQSLTPIIYSIDRQHCSVTTMALLRKDQEVQGALQIMMRTFWGSFSLVKGSVVLVEDTDFSVCCISDASEGIDCEQCAICLELCGLDGGTSCPNTSPGIGE